MTPQPPGTGTLADQLRALSNRIDEVARAKPAPSACVVRLFGDANLPAESDVFAQGGWDSTYDPLDQFVPSAAGVPAHIVVARAGYYRVHFHSAVTGADAVTAAKVTANNPSSVADSLATASSAIAQQGPDGAVLDALRSRVYLDAGDKLYWSNWCAATATLKAASSGVPTEIAVQYVSSQ